MNELNIASVIIRKRREKGITQEELANYIGVSNGAISKWEKGLSYPDITLLPQLAAYFNISIDDLLGYSPQLTLDDIRKQCNKLSAAFVTMPFDEAMAECSAVIKKYHSCFPLLYYLAMLLVNQHQLIEAQDQQDEIMEKARALCERIVSESGDAILAKDALYLQAFCCIALRLPTEVFRLIGESQQMPWFTEDVLISQAFQLVGNIAKAREAAQCGMLTHMMTMIESVLSYIPLCADAPDAAETALNWAMELIELFKAEKLNPFVAVKAYLTGVELNCMLGHTDDALDMLDRLAKLCDSLVHPVKHQGHPFFSAVDRWLEDGVTGSAPPFDERMIKKIVFNALISLPSLSALNGQPRYQSLLRKLRVFAEGGNDMEVH